MLLHAGESVLRSAYGVADASPELPRRTPGVLYLTNRRLLFEGSVSRGFVRDLVGGPDTRLVLDLPLAELRNVSVRRGRFGAPRLVVDATVHHRPSFDLLEPDVWASAIALARRELPPPGLAPPLTVIERQVVKVRCRYCGTLGNEGDTRCPYCGASL